MAINPQLTPILPRDNPEISPRQARVNPCGLAPRISFNTNVFLFYLEFLCGVCCRNEFGIAVQQFIGGVTSWPRTGFCNRHSLHVSRASLAATNHAGQFINQSIHPLINNQLIIIQLNNNNEKWINLSNEQTYQMNKLIKRTNFENEQTLNMNKNEQTLNMNKNEQTMKMNKFWKWTKMNKLKMNKLKMNKNEQTLKMNKLWKWTN